MVQLALTSNEAVSRYGVPPPRLSPRWEGLAPWQAKRVAAYIDDHLTERLGLETLALQVRLSPGHFSRNFKKSFGESLMRFVTRKRIARAQALMARKELRLCDVAYATGFSDQSHFSRTFLLVTGNTPARWRREFT